MIERTRAQRGGGDTVRPVAHALGLVPCPELTLPLDAAAAVAHSERGVTAIEYALMGALIALAIIAGATLLGNDLRGAYNGVANTVGGVLSP